MMGQITEDFVQRAMRCCQLGQHPSLTVWETRQLLTAWVEWQGCRDERDKLDEANRICEQWRQWTVATRAENEALRARVAELEAAVTRYRQYEYVEAQHDETGRSWFGARYNIPTRFHEVSNESGEPGPTARAAVNKEESRNA